MEFVHKECYSAQDLLDIVELLRTRCPWDREQTHESIRKNLIEETYEVAEAIDNGDTALLKEELGDLLLQVVFHTQMEKENGSFDFSDVCDTVCKKLINRHPHVFGAATAENAEQALQGWDEIKKAEKHNQTATQRLKDVPRALPALMRAQKIQQRAAKAGFDYAEVAQAMNDLRSEVREVEEALAGGNPAALEEELGDLIFSAVNITRFARVDAEEALTKSSDKFVARFERVEALASASGIDIPNASTQTLDSLWGEAKATK